MKAKFTETEARYINPLIDFGFHRIFGEESNKDLLIDFLNEIIREEGRITDIQYLPSEQWGNVKEDRKAVFDIFCKTDREEFFIVEMQKAHQPFFYERSIFYAAMAIQKQAPKGLWNFDFKKVYLVAILDFVLFDEFETDKELFIERIRLMRESTNTAYSDKLEFAFVELSKFRKTEQELKTNFDKWLFLLKNLSELKDRPMTIHGKVFDDLFTLAELKRLTKEDMEKYNKSILEYHDVRLCVDYALERGIKKGHEEGIEVGIEKGIRKGREEEKNDIIKKCLQKGYDIGEIAFLTGCSEEKILRLRKN